MRPCAARIRLFLASLGHYSPAVVPLSISIVLPPGDIYDICMENSVKNPSLGEKTRIEPAKKH
jgi:hypothetical protein